MARLLLFVPDVETLSPGTGTIQRGNRSIRRGRYHQPDAAKAAAAFAVGDVIAVRPDGFVFGLEEVAATATLDCPFVIVDIPGPVGQYRYLLAAQYIDTGDTNSDGPVFVVGRKRLRNLALSPADLATMRSGSRHTAWLALDVLSRQRIR